MLNSSTAPYLRRLQGEKTPTDPAGPPGAGKHSQNPSEHRRWSHVGSRASNSVGRAVPGRSPRLQFVWSARTQVSENDDGRPEERPSKSLASPLGLLAARRVRGLSRRVALADLRAGVTFATAVVAGPKRRIGRRYGRRRDR